MSKLVIRLAGESDENVVEDFKNSHFMKSNPLSDAYAGKANEFPSSDFDFFDNTREEVLMAIDESKNNLVGILAAEPIDPSASENMKKFLQKIGDCMDADILNFINYAEMKADIFQRLNIIESFHIQIVSVHPEHRGQGIAKKLFEACFDLAKSKNFKFVSADCTSFYSSKIAEKLGMECLSTVTYEEYNGLLGKQLFVSRPPHNEIRSYAKLM